MFYLILIIIFALLGYLAHKFYFSGGVCKCKNRLDNKIVIITVLYPLGSNSGIGYETALDLAQRGAHIVLACRDFKKAQIAQQNIISSTENKNVFIEILDLASFKSIREFSDRVKVKYEHIDILINNAGFGGKSQWMPTSDGMELHFGTNYLGHFLLTNLLLDLLKKSDASRIINVSSIVHKMASLDFDDMQLKKSYSSFKAYSRSKLALVLFTHELGKQLKNTNVLCFSLHPGVIRTELVETHFRKLNLLSILYKTFYPVFMVFSKNSRQGAQTTIYCAVSDNVKKLNGSYFSDCEPALASRYSRDPRIAERLWSESKKLVDL